MDQKNRILNRAAPPLYYLALSLAVWFPVVFSRGYLLLGDMVFAPSMRPVAGLLGPPRSTYNVVLLDNMVWQLSRVFTPQVVQKIILLCLIFLPGYLMHRMVATRTEWARYFAGTLYCINPFVYTRLLMGQWQLLLGYALLPLAFFTAGRYLASPSRQGCAYTALSVALIALFSLHMAALALFLIVLLYFTGLKASRDSRTTIVAVVSVVVLFALLCSFWLLPALRSTPQISSIGTADLAAFKTVSTSSAGTGLSVIGMYGFWKTTLDPLLPRSTLPLWPVFAIALVALSVIGAASAWNQATRRATVRALSIAAAIGFVLALGTKAPLVGGFFRFFYNNVAPFRLFREPQKFVALLAFSYSMLGAIGAESLVADRKRGRVRRKRLESVLLCLLLVSATCLYSYRVFGGLWGEATAVSYPDSWSKAKGIIDGDRGEYRLLFLPDHTYLAFPFLEEGHTVASPAPLYFAKPYVGFNTIEVNGLRLDATDIDRYVEQVVSSSRETHNLGSLLAPLGVKYLVVTGADIGLSDMELRKQNDLRLAARWKEVVLYQNLAFTSTASLAYGFGRYRSWADLAPLSSGGYLEGARIIKGDKTSVAGSRGEPIAAAGGMTVNIPATDKGATFLYSAPFDENWRFGEKRAGRQLDIVCAFDVLPGPARADKLRYLDTLLIIGYSLSLLSLLACLVLITLGKRRGGRNHA